MALRFLLTLAVLAVGLRRRDGCGSGCDAESTFRKNATVAGCFTDCRWECEAACPTAGGCDDCACLQSSCRAACDPAPCPGKAALLAAGRQPEDEEQEEQARPRQAAATEDDEDDSPSQAALAAHRGRLLKRQATARAHRQGADPLADSKRTIKGHADKVRALPKKAARIPSEVKPMEDAEKSRRLWLPGWKMSNQVIVLSLAFFAVAYLWTQIYFRGLYVSDRSESVAPWAAEDEQKPPVFPEALNTPDLMLVFHHPRHDYDDNEDEVLVDELAETLFVHGESLKSVFPKLKHEMGEKGVTTTKGALREAMLADFMQALPKMGFEVKVFSSADDDEVFMRLSIRDENVVAHYFTAHSTQVQLRKNLVAQLGVLQNPAEHASNPPWVVFDRNLGKTLVQEGVKGIKPQELGDVYRTFHGTMPNGSVSRGVDRISIIEKEIGWFLNMEAAVASGLLVTWYPVHNRWRLHELKHMWGRWDLIFDLTFKQPVNHLWHYFGSRLAFMFAWTGFYSKALTALLIPALICNLFMVVTYFLQEHEDLTLEVLQLSFSVVIIIWARTSANRWAQETNFFVEAWNLNDDLPPVRPAYRGQLVQSSLNERDREIQGSAVKAAVFRWISLVVTLFFCCGVLGSIYIWITLFHGRMDLVASLCLSINIKVFELVFRPVAVALTNLENHKYEFEYANALIWKNFAFESINYYYPFIYLMVFAKYSEAGCPVVEGFGQDCIWALRRQLIGTVFFLVGVYRVVEVFMLYVVARWRLATEDRASDGQPVRRAFMEEQAKYGQYELKDQVETMLQLVLSLGYVVLFGSVAPIVVVIIWAVFVMQLRGSAWLLAHMCRRTFPEDQLGIGAWRDALELLMVAGIFISALMLVIHGEAFQGAYLLTRITFTFLFVFFSSVAWWVLAREYPDKDAETLLMERRRDYVVRKMHDLGYRAKVPQCKHLDTQNKRLVDLGRFDDIPRLDERHPDWAAVDNTENRELNEPDIPLNRAHSAMDGSHQIVP